MAAPVQGVEIPGPEQAPARNHPAALEALGLAEASPTAINRLINRLVTELVPDLPEALTGEIANRLADRLSPAIADSVVAQINTSLANLYQLIERQDPSSRQGGNTTGPGLVSQQSATSWPAGAYIPGPQPLVNLGPGPLLPSDHDGPEEENPYGQRPADDEEESSPSPKRRRLSTWGNWF